MADDVNLRFRLTGEDASAGKALGSVADKAEKTSEKVSGIGKAGIAVGGFVGNMATMGVSALAGLATSAISTGLSTASAMQQASIGFNTLLGSADKSKKFVSDLSKFAANTPFDFPGLVDSSRTLLGVGVAAKDVVPMLTNFGDAAGALAIPADGFQRIMMATSQAISAGKFQAGDLNQIMNNGLPVWTLLAKAMHKSVPELRDLASHGKLLASDVLPALQSQMHKDYGGAMAQQSQTLSGLWSTMQDTFAQGMAKVLMPLVPLLQNVLPGAMDGLGKGLDFVSGVLGSFVSSFSDGDTAIGQFMSGLTMTKDEVTGIGAPLEGLVSRGQDARQMFEAFQGVIVSVVGWFRDALLPALRTAGEQIMPKIREAVASVTQTMREHQDIIQYVQAAFKILGLVITEIIIPVLSQIVQALLSAVGPAFRVVADIISNVVIPVVKFLLQTFLGIVGQIIEGAAMAFGWVPGLGGKLKDASAAFNRFKNEVNGALDGINSHKTVSIDVLVNGQRGSVTNVGGGVYNISVGGNTVRALASGGIVTRPTLAMVGEGPEPEAVIPLSRLGNVGGGGVNVYVTNAVVGNEDQLARVVVDAVNRAQGRGYGPAFG